MGWIVGGAAVLGAGAEIISSNNQSDAAQNAAQLSSDSANYAANLQNQQWQQSFNALQPWRDTGRQNLSYLDYLMQSRYFAPNQNTKPSDLLQGSTISSLGNYAAARASESLQPFQFDPATNPAYQWNFDQGLQALNKSAAARGGYFSGQTGIDLLKYGQGMAKNEYQQQLANYLSVQNQAINNQNTYFGQQYNLKNQEIQQLNDYFNKLASMSNIGQTATGTTANLGAAYAGNIGNILTNSANLQGQYGLAGANAWSQGLTGASNQGWGALGTYLNYNQSQKFLDSLYPQYPTGKDVYNAYGILESLYGGG